ncbi:MAG: hypothetical protein A2W35_08605, partial [Chloroflexi bacterium RBG_16_57_11]
TVRAILTITPEKWTRLCQVLPDGLLRRPAIPGQWSALECLHHLTAAEAVFAFRLNCFLEGRSEFPGYDPNSAEERIDPAATPAALSAEFNRRRAASLQALAKVTEAHLERRARHAELGPVTLGELLHEWAAHDLNHTIQAEHALMQPLILGSGPWQPSFADHLLAQGA